MSSQRSSQNPSGVRRALDGSITPRAGTAAADQTANAVDAYGYVCGTALVLIGLVLFRKGLFPWALFPVGAGLLGLFFRWRIAPVLIIGITSSCLVYAEPGGPLFRGSAQRPAAGYVDLQTWILCSALLAYVIGHYRLQSLSSTIFPADRRSPKSKSKKDQLERPRSSRTVGGGEIGWLIFTLPFVSFASLLLLRLIPSPNPTVDFGPSSWTTLLLLWVLGLGAFLGNSLLAYLALRNLKLEEARLYVQDQLWLELRRDLRRLERWRVWSRLRKDR
jgi:hypothetical protein